MKIIAITTACFVLCACTPTAGVPNMICKAVGPAVFGFLPPNNRVSPRTSDAATDIYRIANGKLYHQWSQRKEYFYNNIVEIEPGRYVSGHIVFVIGGLAVNIGTDVIAGGGNRGYAGYAVTAAPNDWSLVYLDCKA
jgi:hypothetical protein